MAESLRDLVRALRGDLASLRAAAEVLDTFPAMDDSRRRQLLAVVLEEAEKLGTHLDRLDRRTSTPEGEGDSRRRVTVSELTEVLHRAAAGRGLHLDIEPPVVGEIELAVDAVGQGMASFAGALRRDLTVSRGHLGTRIESPHLLVDLAWRPEPGDQTRLHEWHAEALERGDGAPDGGLRPVARRHDGEAWFILGRDGSHAHVRVLLPLVGETADTTSLGESTQP